MRQEGDLIFTGTPQGVGALQNGDVIELIDGYVYRNGEKIDESAYLDDDVRTEMTGISSKFIVGMNQYFVLGDNRSISLDSRMIGPVSTVQGKTWFFFSKAWFK